MDPDHTEVSVADRLYSAWRAAAGASGTRGDADPDQRDAWRSVLAAAYAAAQAAWPTVKLDPATYAAALAVAADLEQTPDAILTLNCNDIYLATACHEGSDEGMLCLTLACRPHIDATLSRFADEGGFRDEISAAVFERLLVGRPGTPPRIASYRGRGRLTRWVRVLATRMAIDRLRGRGGREHAAGGDLSLVAGLDASADPEFSLLRQQYQDDFRSAFEKAVLELDAQDRRLLRERVVYGLGIVRIAELHDTSKSAVARRIGAARARLTAAVHADLRARLKLNPNELQSLLRVVASQLHVSVARILQQEGPP